MFQVCILVVLLALILVCLDFLGVYDPCFDQGRKCEQHSPSYCANTTAAIDLKCPFGFKGDQHPDFCKQPAFELSCDQHNRTVLFLKKLHFYADLEGIDYVNNTIPVFDPRVQKNNCSTLPLYSFSDLYDEHMHTNWDTDALIFVSCKNPVRSKSPLYVDTSSCNITENRFSISKTESISYSYAVIGPNLVASQIEESCTIYKIVPVDLQCLPNKNISFEDIHNLLANGFKLTWNNGSKAFSVVESRSFICRLVLIYWSVGFEIGGRLVLFYRPLFEIGAQIIAKRSVIGVLLLFPFLIYVWRRRHLSMYDKIEQFLQAINNLMPIRYSYTEIKAMTNNFKEKLGEGGYGSVYKGKLRSGDLAAIKMLNKTKGDGQEFINEVATIGRIHHVNVVRLVGFCVAGSKRALVYDYMPNGSLDKFIFSKCSNGDPLDWKKVHEIAIGVARGIEYLHQGCNMQILHFDIKPHNILLDENFVPKVSDFGLAKLSQVQDGYLATHTAARGTLGYMAPEFVYKRIGRVSYKADVYSYGKLLMEMAGRRNVNANAEHSSQIYFPSWIHDKFDQGEDIEIGDHATEDEKKIARRLILIALWCIQMKPDDRPSMREVLKMLEDDSYNLSLPPKPLFYPPDSPRLTQRSSNSSSEDSTEPLYNSVAFEIEHIDISA